MTRSYSDLTLKQIFLTSGHYCAFPDCDLPIVDFSQQTPIILGQIAHIEGSSDAGPRPNSSLSSTQRDSYPNLLVLCAHHHTLVDKIDSEYPVETLRDWKRAAERTATDKLSVGATEVTFVELQLVCNAFADGDIGLISTPMIAVPPQAKMDANNLTSAVTPTMSVGLSQAPQVVDFIRRQAQLSSRFPDRLRAGFVKQYDDLRTAGQNGDELFFSLLEYGTNSAISPQTLTRQIFVMRAAAAAVLCHLFEVCDVFEAPAA